MRFVLSDLFKRFAPAKKKEEDKEIPIQPTSSKKKQKKIVFVDLRKSPRTNKRGKAKGTRNYSKITGIMLHQTACIFSTPERMINVPAHSGVLQDGRIVLLHPPTNYLYHGHKANSWTIGIEVVARAAGIEGDPKTFWRSKSDIEKGRQFEDLVREATDVQIEATKELCRYYIKLVEENGGKIKYMIPHRSSHSSRRSDPGSKLWKEVAIPIMEEFGLELHEPVGSGRPVPESWDSIRGKGMPY